MTVSLVSKGQVRFRIVESHDTSFLIALYSSTRADEMRHAIMSAEDKSDFLRRQFDLQSQAYAQSFPNAMHRIIQLDDMDIGRMIINRADNHMRIIDLSILPMWRGRGIGTDILRSLLNEAYGGKVPVRLHVTQDNPAYRLYARHHFRPNGMRQGSHVELEWQPPVGPREV